MPYSVEKIGRGYYCKNTETGKLHSKKALTKEKAEAQCRLLMAIEHGFKPTGKKGGK